MAVEIKSTKLFKILIGGSALFVSVMAAALSVTGIASLFSGHFQVVAIIMGVLEFAKIIVASFIARYWSGINTIFKTYFVIAILFLMVITSAGIFGYLSDAYQATKGDYTKIENQIGVLETKKNFFVERKNRLEKDKDLEIQTKESNQVRADSLTARGFSINRTRSDIKASEEKISNLENQITIIEDSISTYSLKIIDLQAQNISGELGPLKYISDAFSTDMDTVVKYLIFILIFVFDPLAILMFISLNIILKNEQNTPVESIEKNEWNFEKIKTGSIDENIEQHYITSESNNDITKSLYGNAPPTHSDYVNLNNYNVNKENKNINDVADEFFPDDNINQNKDVKENKKETEKIIYHSSNFRGPVKLNNEE